MTATTAVYVAHFYIVLNFKPLSFGKLHILNFGMALSILLTSVGIPLLVHRIFDIKSKIAVRIFIILSVVVMTIVVVFRNVNYPNIRGTSLMSTIVVSNIYSYIVGAIKIFKLENKKNRRAGIIFLISFLLLFIPLYIIDITNIVPYNGFLFFPMFYICVGSLLLYLGLTRLKASTNNNEIVPKDFIERYKLTKREVEIASHLLKGLTYKDIALKLYISNNTVSSHVKHIYEKTNTKSKIQLNHKIRGLES